MHEYRVITDTNLERLCDQVDHYINNGWWCQGGIAVYSSNVISYAQAITRTVANEQVTQLQEQEARV